MITTDQIQHMVWAQGSRTLYCFANVGNSNRDVSFRYSRGLTTTPTPRKVYKFTTNGVPAVSAGKNIKLGDAETVAVPAHCLVAIEVG